VPRIHAGWRAPNLRRAVVIQAPTRLPTPRSRDLRQFIRFAIVGVIQNGVNIGVFALAVASRVPFLAASVIAAVVALAVSFSLNRLWTFPGTADQTAARMIRFVTVWVIIVLLALPILAVLVDGAHLPKVLAQAIVVIIGAPASFAAQRRWTFANTATPQRPQGGRH
jgi:putative flippase GtrA